MTEMTISIINGVETEVTVESLSHLAAPAGTVERRMRDSLLSETDVWALSDRTMTAEQIAYRQALRDITAQAGFPEDPAWPTKPD